MILCFITVACGDPPIVDPSMTSNASDTTKSFETDISDNGSKTDSVKKTLLDLYTLSKDTLLRNSNIEIENFKAINDSISYCTFVLTDLICLVKFIGLQNKGSVLSIKMIEENCDADFSIPYYEYSKSEWDSQHNVIITSEITERANKKYLFTENGFEHFKDGYTLENSESVLDTSYIIRSISPTGVINERKSKSRD